MPGVRSSTHPNRPNTLCMEHIFPSIGSKHSTQADRMVCCTVIGPMERNRKVCGMGSNSS